MRSFLFALFLLLVVNVVADAGSTIVQYPMATVANEPSEAGIFRNRQHRLIGQQPAPPATPGVPDTDGNRTAPVDPNAAPKFDAAPSGESAPLSLAALTPEQKQQLFTALSSIISALIGAFAGSGKAGPFLTALLGAFKTILNPVPPAPVPARIRTRKPRAKVKPTSPESK